MSLKLDPKTILFFFYLDQIVDLIVDPPLLKKAQKHKAVFIKETQEGKVPVPRSCQLLQGREEGGLEPIPAGITPWTSRQFIAGLTHRQTPQEKIKSKSNWTCLRLRKTFKQVQLLSI